MGAFKSHLNSHRHLFVNGSGGQRAVTGWVYIYISGYVISNSIHLKYFKKYIFYIVTQYIHVNVQNISTKQLFTLCVWLLPTF